MDQLQEFTGVGTVFISDVIGVAPLAEGLSVSAVVEVLQRHLDFMTNIVEKHSGIVLQFAGSAIIAYWHPSHTNPSHAQLAFDASQEILEKLPSIAGSDKRVSYDVYIVLGTGEMTGDRFGPIKQFQVVGRAMTIANRLSSGPASRSTIRMSQYTYELISPQGGIEEAGSIGRENLEDLRVFTYRPANPSINGSIDKLRWFLPSALRAAAARYLKR